MIPISLDNNWRYFPTEIMDAAYGVSELDASSWGVLPNLADYPRDLITVSGTLNLRRSFDLEPIGDICLRLILHLENAPSGTHVYINGWHVGTTEPSVSMIADVTDNVSLEDNLLLLKLHRVGHLANIYLQPVPCMGET